MNPVRALAWLLLPEVRELSETVAVQSQTITAQKVSVMALRVQRDAALREVRELQERLVSAQAGEAAAAADAEHWRLACLEEAKKRHPSAGDES